MELSAQIGELLRQKGWTMGSAESCTGGNIAHQITRIAGSSDYFSGAVVSYSNQVKMHLWQVAASDLEQVGAVSQQVVEQMACGALQALQCDCAVATSGIAGPGGGTPEKPVGTVWIAAVTPEKSDVHCYHFGALREANIDAATEAALKMLYRLLN